MNHLTNFVGRYFPFLSFPAPDDPVLDPSRESEEDATPNSNSADELVAMVREFQRERNDLKRKLEVAESELSTAKKYKECFEAERTEWLSEVTPLQDQANRLWSMNSNYRAALVHLNWQLPPLLHRGIPSEQVTPESSFGNQVLKNRYRQLKEYIQYLEEDNQKLEAMLCQAFGFNTDLSLAQYIFRIREALVNQQPQPPEQTTGVQVQVPSSPDSASDQTYSSTANTPAIPPTKDPDTITANGRPASLASQPMNDSDSEEDKGEEGSTSTHNDY